MHVHTYLVCVPTAYNTGYISFLLWKIFFDAALIARAGVNFQHSSLESGQHDFTPRVLSAPVHRTGLGEPHALLIRGYVTGITGYKKYARYINSESCDTYNTWMDVWMHGCTLVQNRPPHKSLTRNFSPEKYHWYGYTKKYGAIPYVCVYMGVFSI